MKPSLASSVAAATSRFVRNAIYAWVCGLIVSGVGLGLEVHADASTIQFATNNYSVAEWAASVTLNVLRMTDLASVASVDYATVDGTATAGRNYAATHGSLAFAVGETNNSIVVPILNEGFVEGTSTFTVTLSQPNNAVLGTPSSATVRIQDTDVGLQFQFATYSPATHWTWTEDMGTVRIGVVRGDDANIPVTVDFATSDLTATNGVDYIGVTNTLSFAPTERLKFVPVTILNNTLKQTNRTFRATLSNPVGVSLGKTSSTRVTIVDNDQGFQFETNKLSVVEDGGVVQIGVLRGTDETRSTVTVDLATTDRTAIDGRDYTALARTLSFGPGERRKVISIPVLNNGTKETTRTFQVTLSNPTGGAVLGAPTTSIVSIQDNDPGVGLAAGRYTNSWSLSGGCSVTVLRGNDGNLGPISVDFATSDDTAKAGVEYQAVSGRLEFQENETVKNLAIPILRSGSGKSFRVNLSNPSPGVRLGTASTTVTIDGRHLTIAPPFETALTIRRENTGNVITWAGGGQLQRADTPTGPWQTLTNATSPWTVQSPLPRTFYRVARPRLATLYVPSSYTGQTRFPLVMMLHVIASTGAESEEGWQIEPLAEQKAFLYCYPDGTMNPEGWRFWNGTDAFGDYYNSGVDDAGYLRALIQEISRRFAVEPKRVHLAGLWMGGFPAYRVACESADLVAGIASWSGLTFLDTSRCQPSEPVNILQIHGTSDAILAYDGGAIGAPVGGFVPPSNMPPFPGAVQTIQTWAAYNGAQDPVTDPVTSMDLLVEVPGLDTVVTRYASSPPGGTVELWTIKGGAHYFQQTREFSTRMIDWLLAHPKP